MFIDGDYSIGGGLTLAGMLVDTGVLELNGGTSFLGPIFVIGKGDFIRSGGGGGDLLGGIVVADVAGSDRILFTADDCSGEDGILGNSDDGVAQSTYDVQGAGTSTTGYCSAYMRSWQAARPLDIQSFVQR